jgi:hypothetical protein
MSTVKLQCDNHPKYTGINIPREECIICWKIYATNLKLQIKKLKET